MIDVQDTAALVSEILGQSQPEYNLKPGIRFNTYKGR